MTGVLIKRRLPYEDAHGTPQAKRGRDWSDVAVGQGMPRTASYLKLGRRAKEGVHPESQREQGPADTLISNLQPPGL